jgi:hypothetical protein
MRFSGLGGGRDNLENWNAGEGNEEGCDYCYKLKASGSSQPFIEHVRCITVLNKAAHWSVPWASLIQSTPFRLGSNNQNSELLNAEVGGTHAYHYTREG